MRTCCALILSCLFVAGGLFPSVAYCCSVAFSHLTVRLQPEEQQLTATARLGLASVGADQDCRLSLSPQAHIEHLTANNIPLTYRFDAGRLSFLLPTAQKDMPEIVLSYRIRYDDPLPQTTIGVEDPSFGVGATIGAQGAYLSPSTAWYPQSGLPQGPISLRIEGPVGFYGVTSGRLGDYGTADGTSFIEWKVDASRDPLALAAGYYQVFSDQLGDIQVLAFLGSQNAALASTYLDPTKKYLRFFQRLLGPYPYEKFAVVENFLPTGYGLPSWTLLGSHIISLPFIPHTSLPHELVHSWFGNVVGVNYATGNWAEGLTSYLSDYLLKEQLSEGHGRDYRLKLLRDYASLVSADDDYPLEAFVSRRSKTDQAIGYGKSAMVFHMLRRKIGEEGFWDGLRGVVAEGRGQRFSWSDLQRIFEQASNTDLTDFFDQWIYRSGAARLSFEDVRVVDTGAGREVRGVVVQTGLPFALKLALQLKTEAGLVERCMAVDGDRTSFVFRTDAPVLKLVGDPGIDIFRTFLPAELPATINDLRASTNLLVVVPAPDDPLFLASHDLLLGLQQQGAEVIDWASFVAEQATGRDLLFVGAPSPSVRSATGLSHLQAGEGWFRWRGVRYQGLDHSLFVSEKTAETGRVVALFHPLSTSAAQAVARKISHYGRYSHLVFRGGANLYKATGDPVAQGFSVDLGSGQFSEPVR